MTQFNNTQNKKKTMMKARASMIKDKEKFCMMDLIFTCFTCLSSFR